MTKWIPKPNKIKLKLGNWRPITFLNIHAKIISKCLAKRISRALGRLVYSQQTAFIKGIYIGEGIRVISDIMHYAESEDIQGIIVALDLTKALDFMILCFNVWKHTILGHP